MSEPIEDGGSAFPVALQGLLGMSLRDYFAAKSLQGIRASETERMMESEKAARLAYEDADAMLAQRTKGPKDE